MSSAKTKRLAAHNRGHFSGHGILALNLVSSPGSGKTTLLCATIAALRARADGMPVAVIEGDQQTSNDADRIRASGAPAIQVNTGKGCHLDAQMVGDAFSRLPLHSHADAHGENDGGVLFIENVGNLVCPAMWDLGEAAKVAILSVTEGEDKPLKYPDMFAAADLMILNKTDLLPYLQFDVERCIAFARRVNPRIEVLQLSATSGAGMEAWLDWIASARRRFRVAPVPRNRTAGRPHCSAGSGIAGAQDASRSGAGMTSQQLPAAAGDAPATSLVRPTVLACGAWLKNRACLLRGDQVIWSQVHGDLGEADNCLALEASVNQLITRYGPEISAIAHDLHPDFFSTRLAQTVAAQLDVPAIAVQHHHAHIGAVMAEFGVAGPVVGLALDGVGLGLDGAAWGGELLWLDGADWQRLGHLQPLALAGGDTAAREPWRMAAAVLHALGRQAEIAPRFAASAGAAAAQTVQVMLERNLNCPSTTGAGRWFDAAAGVLGISVRQSVEAEAQLP